MKVGVFSKHAFSLKKDTELEWNKVLGDFPVKRRREKKKERRERERERKRKKNEERNNKE